MLVQDTNPALYMSQSQSAQLGGNVEFRTNLWKKVIEAQLNNDGKLFFGLDVQNSLPNTVILILIMGIYGMHIVR